MTLVITVSTLLAGTLADQLTPTLAVWTMVGLIGVAGLGWLLLARPLLFGERALGMAEPNAEGAGVSTDPLEGAQK